MSGAERRKHRRLQVKLPVRVQGWDAAGAAWEEMTVCDDLSEGGVAFGLTHKTLQGQLLHLTLPMPRQFRRYDISAASYTVYALVRWVKRGPDKTHVGVRFFGKHPPKSAQESRGAVFLMPGEKRRHVRVGIRLTVTLRGEDAPGGAPLDETTIAEELSKHGARVRTGLPLAKGQTVEVEDGDGLFKTRAEIRNLTIGDDGVPRIHLLFLDGAVPEELLEKAAKLSSPPPG